MVDVLLIQPSCRLTGPKLKKRRFNSQPLGLAYLAGMLERDKFSVKIVDAIQNFEPIDETLRRIKLEKPKVIGISSMTSNIRMAVLLAKAIKENVGDKCKVGLGGHHISAAPSIIYRYPYFDFGITGEGEITFSEIVRRIIREKENVEGLFHSEVPDLDDLPFPARHLIDWSTYTGNYVVYMQFSRGCPFQCIFCSRPGISNKIRYRSPELTVKEMIKVYKVMGKNKFYFVDDTFNLRKDFVFKLCDAMIDSGYSFRWGAQVRVDFVDDELLKKMKEAGCTHLQFGVESGSERVRNKVIGKGISEDQIKEALQLCSKNGIETQIFLMLGFPTETKDELYETVKFPQKIKNVDVVGVHVTIPLPGSKLFEIAINEGVIPPDVTDKFIRGEFGDGFNGVWPFYVPKGLTLNDLLNAQKIAYRTFYFHPSYILKRFLKSYKDLNLLKMSIKNAINLLRLGRLEYQE